MNNAYTTIIGALLTGVFTYLGTYLLMKPKKHRLACETLYRGELKFGFKKGKITYNDKSITSLGILKIKLQNKSALIIKNPQIDIEFDKDIRILEVNKSFEPSTDHVIDYSEIEKTSYRNIPQISTKIANNILTIVISAISPTKNTNSSITLEVFTDGYSEKIEITGDGEISDNQPWYIDYSQRTKKMQKTQKIARVVYRALFISALTSFLCFIILNNQAIINFILTHISDPLFVTMIIVFFTLILFASILMFRGVYIFQHIPFTNKAIYLSISEKPEKTK